ncbi:hypothetical protein BDF14DRAFT_1208285 [Spinellus fusiger]|nr:hypothetical protein BDF14DRAFT_1208285 [Spinellus fusiger]
MNSEREGVSSLSSRPRRRRLPQRAAIDPDYVSSPVNRRDLEEYLIYTDNPKANTMAENINDLWSNHNEDSKMKKPLPVIIGSPKRYKDIKKDTTTQTIRRPQSLMERLNKAEEEKVVDITMLTIIPRDLDQMFNTAAMDPTAKKNLFSSDSEDEQSVGVDTEQDKNDTVESMQTSATMEEKEEEIHVKESERSIKEDSSSHSENENSNNEDVNENHKSSNENISKKSDNANSDSEYVNREDSPIDKNENEESNNDKNNEESIDNSNSNNSKDSHDKDETLSNMNGNSIKDTSSVVHSIGARHSSILYIDEKTSTKDTVESISNTTDGNDSLCTVTRESSTEKITLLTQAISISDYSENNEAISTPSMDTKDLEGMAVDCKTVRVSFEKSI